MKLKILACATAAMVLTALMTSPFLNVTSAVRSMADRETVHAVAAVDSAKGQLLRAILPRFAG